MSVIKGTKDLKNFHVLKGQSDTRQIRCTKCNDIATQVPDGKGGFVYKCGACLTQFKMTQI